MSANENPANREQELKQKVEPLSAEASQTNPAAEKTALKTNRKIRVLLVDDHQIVRESLAKLLQEQSQIQVVGGAGDGQSAVELVRQLKPDVVIMDLGLPQVSGFEATRQIVSEHPGIRVIGLSAHENEEFAAEMRKAGAADYLTKGAPAERLIEAIRAGREPIE
jgi:DNA-binding NarL/FixJ family response regulator